MHYNKKDDSYLIQNDSVNFFINISFQITGRCNLDCFHCCASLNSCPKKEFTLEQLKPVIDDFSNSGLEKIIVTGGEPTLRNDLPDILEYIKSKNIQITLSTNGYSLSSGKIKEIKPHISNIRFSLHGLKKTHNRITGNHESFGRVINSIRLSKRVGLPVSVVMSVMKKNIDEMIASTELCEKEGVDKLYFFPLMKKGRGISVFEEENVELGGIKSKFNKILDLIKSNDWNIKVGISDQSKRGGCILMYPNGDLLSSQRKGNLFIGNVFSTKAKDLWKNFSEKENHIAYYKKH